MLLVALLGFGFAFVGSMPIAGPIAALVLSRGLQGRYAAASWIAVGCGLVEGLYAALAYWGFSTFLARYPVLTPISRGVGAAVMVGLGITFLRMRMSEDRADRPVRDTWWRSLLLGAWICAINPTLIISWSAVVTTIHGSEVISLAPRHALPFAAGVGGGATSWFLVMVALLRRYRERFSTATLQRTIRGLGLLLLGLGLWFAVRFVGYFTA